MKIGNKALDECQRIKRQEGNFLVFEFFLVWIKCY